jgi:hypothetical protein
MSTEPTRGLSNHESCVMLERSILIHCEESEDPRSRPPQKLLCHWRYFLARRRTCSHSKRHLTGAIKESQILTPMRSQSNYLPSFFMSGELRG